MNSSNKARQGGMGVGLRQNQQSTVSAENSMAESAAPSRKTELVKELEAEEEHSSLQRRGRDLLRMVGPVRTQMEEQVSVELFGWFKHQGFWPEWWQPHDVTRSAFLRQVGENQEDVRTVTIPFSEYIRLKKMEKLGLIVTEVAETMEAVRQDDHENEIEELADIDVRLHDYKGGFGLTNEATPFVESAAEGFIRKMLKNFERPFRHGKRF